MGRPRRKAGSLQERLQSPRKCRGCISEVASQPLPLIQTSCPGVGEGALLHCKTCGGGCPHLTVGTWGPRSQRHTTAGLRAPSPKALQQRALPHSSALSRGFLSPSKTCLETTDEDSRSLGDPVLGATRHHCAHCRPLEGRLLLTRAPGETWHPGPGDLGGASQAAAEWSLWVPVPWVTSSRPPRDMRRAPRGRWRRRLVGDPVRTPQWGGTAHGEPAWTHSSAGQFTQPGPRVRTTAAALPASHRWARRPHPASPGCPL